jgi:TIR domain/Pentapeptide repeats (8 copies)
MVPRIGISYSEAEYDEAYRLGKPCLAYMRRDDVPILPKFVEGNSRRRALLRKFREKIRERHTVGTFSDERDLSIQVSVDLGRLISTDTTNDVLSIIHQGARTWNVWRIDNRDAVPDLASSDLSTLDLSGFDLSNINLNNANLSGTNLSFANLSGASLVRSNLSGAVLDNTILNNIDLREANVEACAHKGRSFIDIYTLQKAILPIGFLRGCGISDTIIDVLHSVTNTNIEFYSCLLAFAAGDSAFAERLYRDLQTAGVRCWSAMRDLPSEQTPWGEIEDPIRSRDRLVIILSAESIASDWIEGEVIKAYSEERARKDIVLLPVSVDRSIVDTAIPWACTLRDQRNIANSKNWEDREAYLPNLDRLLRDLRTSR